MGHSCSGREYFSLPELASCLIKDRRFPRMNADFRAPLAARLAARLVGWSIRRPALVLAATLLVAALSCWVVVTRFALNTDVVALFPQDIPWRQTEVAMDRAFPQRVDLIAVVVDGATPRRGGARRRRPGRGAARPSRRCSAASSARMPTPSSTAARCCSWTRPRSAPPPSG